MTGRVGVQVVCKDIWEGQAISHEAFLSFRCGTLIILCLK